MYGSYYTHIITAPRSKKARPSLAERQDCTTIQGRLQPNTAIDTTGSACMAITTCITTVIPASMTITASYTLRQQSFRSVLPPQHADHSVSSSIIPAYVAITTCWTLCQQLHYSGLCGHHNMLNTLSAVTLFRPMWPSQHAEHSVSSYIILTYVTITTCWTFRQQTPSFRPVGPLQLNQNSVFSIIRASVITVTNSHIQHSLIWTHSTLKPMSSHQCATRSMFKHLAITNRDTFQTRNT